MKRFLFFTFFVFVIGLAVSGKGYARTETIAAIVNEDALTVSDLEDRLKLVILSSGLPNTTEIRERLVPQVISGLIEEQIRLQEAERLEIKVGDEEIREGFETIAKQNNFEPEQFEEILKRSGINVSTLRQQIRSQIAWGKVVSEELRPKIVITDSDIQSYLQRLQNNAGKTEYLVAEIFLSVEQAADESNVRNLAGRLAAEVKEGKAPFFKLAQQFSQAAGASQGGDIGWVQKGHVAEEVEESLSRLDIGEVTEPVRTVNGFHILLLRDKRVISEENMPDRDMVTQRLGLERLERLQRRYLLDLKAASYIENRVRPE